MVLEAIKRLKQQKSFCDLLYKISLWIGLEY